MADSLSTVRAAARLVREQKGRIRDTVDLRILGKNIGNSWSEVDYAALTASAITETTNNLDNPEQMSDTLISLTPTDGGIHILYTDRVADRILSEGAAIVKNGQVGMNAILRKQDIDGIVQGRAATVDMGTAGAPLVSSLVRHARYRISSNVTESNPDGPYYMQHHGFCLADIDDELSAPLGTYEITAGVSAEVIAQGYSKAPRMLGGVNVQENGNMTIDASDDSEGFIYVRDGFVLVEGMGLRTEVLRRPNIGGGATSMFFYFEYAWGFRSSGNWQFSLTADALAPA